MYLEEYLKTKSLSECIELNNLIQKNGSSFKASIVALMKKNYIDNKQIAAYQKKCTKKVEEQLKKYRVRIFIASTLKGMERLRPK